METKEANKTVLGIVLQHQITEAVKDLVLKYNLETGLIPKKIVVENIPCHLVGEGRNYLMSHTQLEDQIDFSVSPEVLSEST